MAPLRIAILEADRPLPETTAKYGSYGGVFSSLLHKAASSTAEPSNLRISSLDTEGSTKGSTGTPASFSSEETYFSQPSTPPELELDIKKYDISYERNFPKSLDEIDAILITGSKHNAYDDTPWIVELVEYVQKVLFEQTRVKVLGICFGHQIIARALGVEVQRSPNWEASVMPIKLSEDGKALFGVEELRIFQMHRDVVTSIPSVSPFPDNASTHILGSSDRCDIQGMYSPGHFISVQGHPEFTPDIVTELLTTRKKAGVFTEEEYNDMMGRVKNEHDGVKIARRMLKFVGEGI